MMQSISFVFNTFSEDSNVIIRFFPVYTHFRHKILFNGIIDSIESCYKNFDSSHA